MATSTLDRPTDRAAKCTRCDDQVFKARTPSGRTITLDYVIVVGGLYRLDEYGQAQRRGLVELFNEERGLGRQSGGYAEHQCEGEQPFRLGA